MLAEAVKQMEVGLQLVVAMPMEKDPTAGAV
jgi:hypothetical protein